MTMQELNQEAEALFNLTLTETQIQQFDTYGTELLAWNDKHNLTAIRDEEGVRRKHFLDSLSCVLGITKAPASMIDIGSGGGFPGLPLKLLYPDMRLTLADSVAKKTAFLTHMSQTLEMDDVTVLTNRAEEIGRMDDHREAYQWAVARAVAHLPILAEYLLPLVQVGGFMLAQKGETAPREVDEARSAFAQLGGKLHELIPVELEGLTPRYLVIVEKISKTPDEFPRHVGTPSKRPLS